VIPAGGTPHAPRPPGITGRPGARLRTFPVNFRAPGDAGAPPSAIPAAPGPDERRPSARVKASQGAKKDENGFP